MSVALMDVYLALLERPCEDLQLVMIGAFNHAVDITRPLLFELFQQGTHGQYYSQEQVCIFLNFS